MKQICNLKTFDYLKNHKYCSFFADRIFVLRSVSLVLCLVCVLPVNSAQQWTLVINNPFDEHRSLPANRFINSADLSAAIERLGFSAIRIENLSWHGLGHGSGSNYSVRQGKFEDFDRERIETAYEFSGINHSMGDLIRVQASVSNEESEDMAVGHTFKDCSNCPKMTVVPGGTYMMGSPDSERRRKKNEGPQHQVSIQKFAVGVYEVTREEYQHFVNETGRSIGNRCNTFEKGKWKRRSKRNLNNPGFSQIDLHPAVCVNWRDAKAYVKWLSRKTGHQYRLLSEAEWEYVARSGSQQSRFWGHRASELCRFGNGGDLAVKEKYSSWEWRVVPCRDEAVHTAAVGSYEPNGFGLYDVLGNVWELVEDCWHDSYAGAPRDGSAWTRGGNCDVRVARGGSWTSGPKRLRSAYRGRLGVRSRNNADGFRVARTLAP